jgi:AraC-like DNA-binding protein
MRWIAVLDLAAVAKMSVSTFHQHFRTLTQMSPLQYQKRMRLHLARVRMMTEGLDAASAGFEVGYESATQFDREYRRLASWSKSNKIETRSTVANRPVDLRSPA